MTYVPYSEEFNFKYYINDEGNIVVSKEYEIYDDIICYRTYYPHSDYIYNTRCDNGFNYGNTFELLDYSDSTQSYFYRVDYTNILICITILLLFVIILPYKIISRLFGRWLKL